MAWGHLHGRDVGHRVHFALQAAQGCHHQASWLSMARATSCGHGARPRCSGGREGWMWLPCSGGSGQPWTSQWSTTPSPATASTLPSPSWGWATSLVPWWVPPPDQCHLGHLGTCSCQVSPNLFFLARCLQHCSDGGDSALGEHVGLENPYLGTRTAPVICQSSCPCGNKPCANPV